MDALRNPFAPGAGTRPPELAGRRDILERAEVTLGRTKVGKHAKSFMLIGLRGVEKTVLLNRILDLAEQQAMRAIMIEAHEDKELAELIFPTLRKILLSLDRSGQINESVKRAFRTLKSFAKSVRIKYGDLELSVDPEKGSADSGDLESDLPDLLMAVGWVEARDPTTLFARVCWVSFVDPTYISRHMRL
ncbi:MAG: ATP-binding protein, partial [Hyphomicrobium sp.]